MELTDDQPIQARTLKNATTINLSAKLKRSDVATYSV